LPAARALLQRAFAIADRLALAAALIFLLGCVADFTEVVPLILAHPLAPAAILARAAALILRFFRNGALSEG